MIWKIKAVTGELTEKDRTTVLFAASEFKKYISMCCDDQIFISEQATSDGDGLFFGIGLSPEIPTVLDKELDDAVFVDVKGRQGIISGTNARSVLISVYRYLRELGFIFIRPGKYGEIIPEKLCEKDVSINETPTSRHRCICIEGSVFYECVEDMIDWIPKVGMNGYLIQFFSPVNMYNRWFDTKGGIDSYAVNPYRDSKPLSYDEVTGITKCQEWEIEKRSLVYISVGHGWTCAPLGISTWVAPGSNENDIVPEGASEYFAEINGERKLYQGSTLYTQLCYGRKEVRDKMVDFVVDYCRKNPNVTYISYCLADGANNYCECDICRKKRPSDWYVMILNEIDARLTEENIKTKIMFCIYVDLLWPPETERIINEDRFVLMYCPISRTHSVPLDIETNCEMNEFSYNNLKFPQKPDEFAAYLKGWRDAFGGECIVFDYYYMWNSFKDNGDHLNARIIHEDISNYEKMKMAGLISCQVQRAFSPTALGMNIMARSLWDKNCDFETERLDILHAEFGRDYLEVADYLEELTLCCLPRVQRFETAVNTEENVAFLERGIKLVEGFVPVIDKNLMSADEIRMVSWQNLEFQARLTKMILEGLLSLAKGIRVPDDCWNSIEDFVNRHELENRMYFDAYEFKYVVSAVYRVWNKRLAGIDGVRGDITKGEV